MFNLEELDISYNSIAFIPNEYFDWLSERNSNFDKLIPVYEDKNKNTFFKLNSSGVVTGRDSWVYNFSKNKLIANMKQAINFYMEQQKLYKTEFEKMYSESRINKV